MKLLAYSFVIVFFSATICFASNECSPYGCKELDTRFSDAQPLVCKNGLKGVLYLDGNEFWVTNMQYEKMTKTHYGNKCAAVAQYCY
ncbi:MAG: hypothetical protein OCC45_10715 [Desulfotalea sp.]